MKYLLPYSIFFCIPFRNNLSFPYYFLFALYIVHRALPTNSFKIKNKMFELLAVSSLYSYYIFHNIYLSYIISSLILLEYVYSEGFFFYFGIFLYSYLHNMKDEKIFLFVPFVFSCFILSKTFCFDRRTKLSSLETILWDISQFYFFWYSSQGINIRENFQC